MSDVDLKKTLHRLGTLPTPFPVYSTAFLGDAMQKLGIENRVLDPAIRPLLPFTRMVGTAVTLKLDLADKPETKSVTEYYGLAFEAGKRAVSPILVIEMPFAKFGSLGSGAAHIMRNHYGFVGAVVDGVVRDTDELARMNFSVYYRYVHPEHVDGVLRATSVNEPIAAGGVTINPADIIVGDNDGVAVVPHAQLGRVMEVTAEIMRIEEQIIREIDEGKPYQEVGKKHFGGPFAQDRGVRYHAGGDRSLGGYTDPLAVVPDVLACGGLQSKTVAIRGNTATALGGLNLKSIDGPGVGGQDRAVRTRCPNTSWKSSAVLTRSTRTLVAMAHATRLEW